ncbi:hypothetical protein FB45DRAFT_947586 [Roridomyces roridus]|uniref:Uncharacterized protein n=1 Tax=Roridomyces roridus TaxID=1738132 RepID=A0AAD7FAS3_9AGAR|nr:hypothetical protein FB45DRAFT_947586 [Roridomyces roridus]
MENGPRFSSNFSFRTAPDGVPQYPGAFFPASQDVVVQGGTFTSNVHIHQEHPTPTEDYRWIRRGDIHLMREIRLGRACSAVYRCPNLRNDVRRVYSAKVQGAESQQAVVVYQGENAQHQWRDFVVRHSRFWHPNVLQIFGLANFSGIYAVITQDDLLTYADYLELRRLSPLMTIYQYACWEVDSWNIWLRSEPPLPTIDQTIPWIKCSTGRLCVEFSNSCFAPDINFLISRSGFRLSNVPEALNETNSEMIACQMLPLDLHHDLCLRTFAHFVRVETPGVIPGAIVYGPTGSSVIVPPPPGRFATGGWYCANHWKRDPVLFEDALGNGWTGFSACMIYKGKIRSCYNAYEDWLPQANHVFTHLGVFSDQKDYIFVRFAQCVLHIPTPRVSPPPDGYLFVRSPVYMMTDRSSFAWSQSAWFWSLDPTGTNPLTEEDALNHGFPVVELTTSLLGVYWDTEFYKELRRFHAAKGFDPDSQDVAKHLGCSLMELPGDKETIHAHGQFHRATLGLTHIGSS